MPKLSKIPEQAPGGAFHLPAAQQVNVANLLKILSSKPATEALKEIGKTKDSTWNDIKDSVSGLNDFVSAGGIDAIIEGFKETVDLQIEAALSPLTNQVNQMIIDALNPLKEKLNDIFNDLNTFIAENKTGALVGAMGGQIASMFLPGGTILVAMGALIGAGIEALIARMRTLDLRDTIEKAAELYGGKLGARLAEMSRILDLMDPTTRRPEDPYDADYMMDKLIAKFDLEDKF